MLRTPYSSHIGEKINKLTIIDLKKQNNNFYFLCKCDCGTQKWINCDSVIRNVTKSCGCIARNPGYEDLTGRKFGRLLVIKYAGKKGNKRKRIAWLCKCDCGKQVEILGENLKQGISKSCGCYCIQRIKNKNTKHGFTKTRIFNIYIKIKERCLNEHSKAYKDYGGRGIVICNEWLGESGFINFKNWADKNGYSESLTIDRIDNNGNYEPSNCRWVDKKVQANNRRSNRKIKYNGMEKTIAEWSDFYNIPYMRIYTRLKLKMPLCEVFNTNIIKKRSN